MSDIKDILVAIDTFVIKHPEIRGHKDFGSLLRDLSVEIDKLSERTRWKRMDKEFPDHPFMVALADFRDTQWGLSTTTGWYCKEFNQWVYPLNYRNMTHWKDCYEGDLPLRGDVPEADDIDSVEHNDYLLKQAGRLLEDNEKLMLSVRSWQEKYDMLKFHNRLIPVSERLPDKETIDVGDEYIVYNAKLKRVHTAEFVGGSWYSGRGNYKWNENHITHWMKLPIPQESIVKGKL